MERSGKSMTSEGTEKFRAVVVGGSAGGIDALLEILPLLPYTFPLPIIIVLHLPESRPSLLSEIFGSKTVLRVKDADEKELIRPGTVYFSPPDYHLLVERDFTFSLSVEAPVQFSRPSIDVLFESAADAWGEALVGVLLSGANRDGAAGLSRIHYAGGIALIQDPATAQVRSMPDAACEMFSVARDHILSPKGIAVFLSSLKTSLNTSEIPNEKTVKPQ